MAVHLYGLLWRRAVDGGERRRRPTLDHGQARLPDARGAARPLLGRPRTPVGKPPDACFWRCLWCLAPRRRSPRRGW